MISVTIFMNLYEQMAKAIIDKVAFVLGRKVALTYAKEVSGLSVNGDGQIVISGKPEQVIADLIDKYRTIAGPAAIIFSQSAASQIMRDNPALLIPEVLRIKM